MPAYKVEPYITNAIDSILYQSFQDWELIVVDDGSPDNSAKIAERYSEKDERIKVVHKKNGGLSSARNFGLQFATGEYVTFFDSDDYALPYFLSNLLYGEKETNPDVIIGGYQVEYIDKSGKSKIIIRDCPIDGKFNGSFGIEAALFVNYAWNKLFRREFLISHNLLYEEGLYRIEDAEFMSRLIKFNPKIIFVKQIGYMYVQRPVTTLSNVFDDTILNHSRRRINIDKICLAYFNSLSDEEQTNLDQFLRQSSASALLSRVYSQSNLTRNSRRRILNDIKSEILPASLIKRKSNLKANIKYQALLALSKGRYWIVDLIYKSFK